MIKNIKKNKNLTVGSTIVIIFVLVAAFAPLIAPYHPIRHVEFQNVRAKPSLQHLMGTDKHGRDVLSRIIYGSRISIMIALIAQTMNTLIGVTLGILGGYFGGRIDSFVVGLTNFTLSMPSLILALTLVAVLGPGLLGIVIAVGTLAWTYTCRVARSQALSLKNEEFVGAAKGAGGSNFWIIRKHILPNILGPVLVIATLGVASAILMESTLSFLGLGIQPPTPSWGAMIGRNRDLLFYQPWICAFPGLAIFFVVVGLNLLGDGIRDKLDPHIRTQMSR